MRFFHMVQNSKEAKVNNGKYLSLPCLLATFSAQKQIFQTHFMNM